MSCNPETACEARKVRCRPAYQPYRNDRQQENVQKEYGCDDPVRLKKAEMKLQEAEKRNQSHDHDAYDKKCGYEKKTAGYSPCDGQSLALFQLISCIRFDGARGTLRNDLKSGTQPIACRHGDYSKFGTRKTRPLFKGSLFDWKRQRKPFRRGEGPPPGFVDNDGKRH